MALDQSVLSDLAEALDRSLNLGDEWLEIGRLGSESEARYTGSRHVRRAVENVKVAKATSANDR